MFTSFSKCLEASIDAVLGEGDSKDVFFTVECGHFFDGIGSEEGIADDVGGLKEYNSLTLLFS